MKEETFYSLGCQNCKGIQLGQAEDGMEFIPIFATKALAQIEMSNGWQSEADEEGHPPRVIEIVVRIK